MTPRRRDGCWLVLGALLLAPAVAPAATIDVAAEEGAVPVVAAALTMGLASPVGLGFGSSRDSGVPSTTPCAPWNPHSSLPW